MEHQKQFWDLILKGHLKNEGLDAFYAVSTETLEKTGAAAFVRQAYGGSLYAALSAAFPDHVWEPHLFKYSVSKAPSTGSDAPKSRFAPIRKPRPEIINAIEAYKNALGITEPEQMYQLGFSQLESAFNSLAPEYQKHFVSLVEKEAPAKSIQLVAMHLFPRFEFKPWSFSLVERNYWRLAPNRRLFFEAMGKSKGIDHTCMEKWYEVRHADIIRFGGNGVLGVFKSSLPKALRDAFPNHGWQEWRFHRSSFGNWRNAAAARHMFDTLLDGKPLETLYSIGRTHVSRLKHGRKLIAAFDGSVVDAIRVAYPDHAWDLTQFKRLT